MRILSALFLSVLINITAVSQSVITSPEKFLGYPLGTKFTRHHDVVAYFDLLQQEAAGRMKLVPYGETHEGRPLFTAILSSRENMDRLEEIRVNNLRRSGLMEGTASDMDVAIVWLSYNVHGDEPVSTEAALKTIHKLLDPTDKESAAWLENTVVIIDPCINPDGRERYVQFYSQFRQQPVNVLPEALSHNQSWPSGRVNHYLFDLNRDWLWQTQIESRQRLDLYHEWMPHIHVDFHEQGYNSPYYFAPGAEPYHAVITDWQRQFQVEIGKNNARHFDKNYWSYFTAEVFDLLYPSYGDTYPTFNGAIGMTYEQGGGAAGGTAVITEYGDTLTLADRIEHHFTTGFATVEIASKHSAELEREFGEYFSAYQSGPYQGYLVSGTNDPSTIARLTDLLDRNRIRYGYRTGNKAVKGLDFTSGRETTMELHDNDIVIPVNQPKGRLVTAMFEPETFVQDSVTYDLTAWNISHAYGLSGASLTVLPSFAYESEAIKSDKPALSGNDYGYLLPYTAFSHGVALSRLLKANVRLGVTNENFQLDGGKYAPGTIVILKGNNTNINLGKVLNDIQRTCNVQFVPVSTGITPVGADLGSNKISALRNKRIAVIAGEGTSQNNVGEIWHFLEQEVQYPMTLLKVSMLGRVNLSKFDVILLPEGRYSGFSSQLNALKEWTSAGGRLIVFGSAISQFADEENSAIHTKADDKEEKKDAVTYQSVGSYGERYREGAGKSIPGAIFNVKIDNTHPLGYGYSDNYFTLKDSAFGPVRLSSGQVVGQLEANAVPVNGFAGKEARGSIGGSVVFGVVNSGSGKIILLVDNPLYRSFWENGKLFVLNAIFLN